jgi:hypothetical protein
MSTSSLKEVNEGEKQVFYTRAKVFGRSLRSVRYDRKQGVVWAEKAHVVLGGLHGQ